MKRAKKINWLTQENVGFLLLLAFLISFYLHYRVNGFMAMVLIIVVVLKMVARRVSFAGAGGILFFPLIFVLLLTGQLYTADLKEGWTLVERNLALLALPFAMQSIVQMNEKRQNWLMNAFIGGAFITGLVCLTIACWVSWKNGSIYTIPNDSHFLYNRFMHHKLTDPVGMHAVYFSVFVALSSIVILNRVLTEKMSRTKMVGLVLLFVFFCGLLYLLKSANVALGFSLCVVVVLLYRFGRQLLNQKKYTLGAVLIFLVIAGFAYTGVTNKLESFSFEREMADEQMTPLGIRLSIWDCAWQVIEENWFLGTGTGDAQNELMKKYQENAFTIGIQHDFNAHNMFLQYWMSNGIPMLIVLSILLGVLFKKAVQHQNVIFISFLILFTLFSLTESTLRTQKGLLFFISFASLFYWFPPLWTVKRFIK